MGMFDFVEDIEGAIGDAAGTVAQAVGSVASNPAMLVIGGPLVAGFNPTVVGQATKVVPIPGLSTAGALYGKLASGTPGATPGPGAKTSGGGFGSIFKKVAQVQFRWQQAAVDLAQGNPTADAVALEGQRRALYEASGKKPAPLTQPDEDFISKFIHWLGSLISPPTPAVSPVAPATQAVSEPPQPREPVNPVFDTVAGFPVRRFGRLLRLPEDY